MNGVGASILALVLCLVLFSSRRWAVIGMMGAVLYITQGQQLPVFGVNMYAMRFVELAAFFRVISRGELNLRKLNGIDKMLFLLFTYTTIIFVARSDDQQVNRIGAAVDALLCYFSFRGLLVDTEDFRWFLKRFLLLLAPYAAMVVFETLTGNNLFSSMGGVLYGGEGWMRGGRMRSQGSFRQASLLGTLGACFFPLYVGLWFSKFDRKLAILGVILCLTIVWASNSGGPASATMVAILGWFLWRFRNHMKLVRRGLLGGFIVLATVMNAPVWYILARLGSVTGGSGWHRAHLMDEAFQNLDKWWLWGMPIQETRDWFPYVLSITGGADITNGYLAFGIDAGLFPMLLFFALLFMAYKRIGRKLDEVCRDRLSPNLTEYFLWGLGVMLTVHCSNWLSITYFDQTYVIWYFQLALITNLTNSAVRSTNAPPPSGEKLSVNDPENISPGTHDPHLA